MTIHRPFSPRCRLMLRSIALGPNSSSGANTTVRAVPFIRLLAIVSANLHHCIPRVLTSIPYLYMPRHPCFRRSCRIWSSHPLCRRHRHPLLISPSRSTMNCRRPRHVSRARTTPMMIYPSETSGVWTVKKANHCQHLHFPTAKISLGAERR